MPLINRFVIDIWCKLIKLAFVIIFTQLCPKLLPTNYHKDYSSPSFGVSSIAPWTNDWSRWHQYGFDLIHHTCTQAKILQLHPIGFSQIFASLISNVILIYFWEYELRNNSLRLGVDDWLNLAIPLGLRLILTVNHAICTQWYFSALWCEQDGNAFNFIFRNIDFFYIAICKHMLKSGVFNLESINVLSAPASIAAFAYIMYGVLWILIINEWSYILTLFHILGFKFFFQPISELGQLILLLLYFRNGISVSFMWI